MWINLCVTLYVARHKNCFKSVSTCVLSPGWSNSLLIAPGLCLDGDHPQRERIQPFDGHRQREGFHALLRQLVEVRQVFDDGNAGAEQ